MPNRHLSDMTFPCVRSPFPSNVVLFFVVVIVVVIVVIVVVLLLLLLLLPLLLLLLFSIQLFLLPLQLLIFVAHAYFMEILGKFPQLTVSISAFGRPIRKEPEIREAELASPLYSVIL